MPRRSSTLGLSGLLLGFLVGCGDPGGAIRHDATPDDTLLIAHGTVLTLDPEDRIFVDGAVAVQAGRITALGSADEMVARFAGARVVDAGGGIILPGLINAHTHAAMVLFRGMADDLPLMEWLQEHIFPAEARHVDSELVRWGTELACIEMLRGGITTFVDMYYFEDTVAEAAARCGIRAVVGETLIDFPAPDNATWDEAVAYTRRFVGRWRGHPRITPAVAPHAVYTVSAEHLVAAHALALELDVPLLIHLSEDRAEIDSMMQRSGRSPIDYLDGLGVLDDRMLAAHVVWPTQDELGLLARRGVGVAHCPRSNMKIAAGIAPLPAMLRAGIAIGLGTDGAASNNELDLWQEMDTAARLHKVVSGDPTVVDARTALRMATVEGARALGMESEIGSLEVGKRADLIVVATDGYHQTPSYDPYSTLTYSTTAADVRWVVVDGRVVVEAGRVTTLDTEETLAQVGRLHRSLVAARAAAP